MSVKRNKSKITEPTASKEKLVAFRASTSLQSKLEEYNNKSEVITEALELYFKTHKVCPKCGGTGKIKKG